MGTCCSQGGLPWWLSGKESTFQCRRGNFDPWSGKISWRRNGNPLQHSCLENSMDRGAGWAIAHGVTELEVTVTEHHHHSLSSGRWGEMRQCVSRAPVCVKRHVPPSLSPSEHRQSLLIFRGCSQERISQPA